MVKKVKKRLWCKQLEFNLFLAVFALESIVWKWILIIYNLSHWLKTNKLTEWVSVQLSKPQWEYSLVFKYSIFIIVTGTSWRRSTKHWSFSKNICNLCMFNRTMEQRVFNIYKLNKDLNEIRIYSRTWTVSLLYLMFIGQLYN